LVANFSSFLILGMIVEEGTGIIFMLIFPVAVLKDRRCLGSVGCSCCQGKAPCRDPWLIGQYVSENKHTVRINGKRIPRSDATKSTVFTQSAFDDPTYLARLKLISGGVTSAARVEIVLAALHAVLDTCLHARVALVCYILSSSFALDLIWARSH
jgi:hypothetical protein